MLKIEKISKTFNPGTIHEKAALQGLLEEHGIEVLRIPSGELSRGRGGPRCMSMPLCRDC